MSTIEPYRRRIFGSVLYTFDEDGRLRYNPALCGRVKKNWKTADLILAGLYRLLTWPSEGAILDPSYSEKSPKPIARIQLTNS
jgi:hypothetical protein